MASFALYPVHFYCPGCHAPGSAAAQEFHGSAGKHEFALVVMNGNFKSNGITPSQFSQCLVCSCGHEFTPDLFNGAGDYPEPQVTAPQPAAGPGTRL